MKLLTLIILGPVSHSSLRNRCAYLGNGIYAEFMSVNVIFVTDCSQLGKRVSEPEEISSLRKLFERYQDSEKKFSYLRDHSYTHNG